jgi:hypothetical protein
VQTDKLCVTVILIEREKNMSTKIADQFAAAPKQNSQNPAKGKGKFQQTKKSSRDMA